jgi:hypothetical protein
VIPRIHFEDSFDGEPSELIGVPVVGNVHFKVFGNGRLLWSPFRALKSYMPYPSIEGQEIDPASSIWEFSADRALANAVSSTWAEFGVLNGISARYYLSRLPKGGRMYMFDSFQGIPEPWENYPAGHFKADPPDFNDDRAILKEGWFKDTLPLDDVLGLVNIDSDLYSSAKEVLAGINVVAGSVIVFDEFFFTPGWKTGEYKALMEWDREWRFLARDGRYAVAIEVL